MPRFIWLLIIMAMTLSLGFLRFSILSWLAAMTIHSVTARDSTPLDLDPQFLLVGVSGGLQDGFPDHNKMDYHVGLEDEVRAIFIGRALVRGCKAFLDVMQDGWRQYTPEPAGQPLINSVVMVSGCQEHANQYWIYAVDSRQFLTILNNEPRFLSITPDTGLVDLATNETDDAVKQIALHEIQKQNKTDTARVAFPIVVATWYHESFVPSPPVRIHVDDGTAVTNFAESLAKWAGVDDEDRLAGCSDDTVVLDEECPFDAAISTAQNRYWDGIRKAVRHAEVNRLPRDEWKANGPPFDCQEDARLGVSSDIARINYPFSSRELDDIFRPNGYSIDFERAEVKQVAREDII
jgi:hypothetical protein